MLDKETRSRIARLIEREVVPATGCTEPAAVSLNCAVGRRRLGSGPVKVEVALSGNMLKNAMGVGIPGTGMRGLPIAIALGVLVGRDDKGLDVLCDVNPAAVAEAKDWLAANDLRITHKADAPDILYIETVMTGADGSQSRTITVGSHANILAEGEEARPACSTGSTTPCPNGEELTMKEVWDYATTTPVDELTYLEGAMELNGRISRTGLREDYGHGLGRMLRHSAVGRMMGGDSVLTHILSATAAACDARMGGAPAAVMSNSGSGNQGIAATLPVMTYAQEIDADRETMLRALTLSHLTAIYIKQSLGRLSALCGCVVASTGSACGICYLMKGGYPEICATAKNMVANLTGMICDGAKPGCALKLTGGVSMAVMSAMMAVTGRCVTSQEGIVDDDVDRSIHNLTEIGREGMKETDRLILRIMTNK